LSPTGLSLFRRASERVGWTLWRLQLPWAHPKINGSVSHLRGGKVWSRGRDAPGFRQFSGKGTRMNTLIAALITFVVVILVLYLVNMLPIDGRAKQIVGVIVIIIGIISLLKDLMIF
jgi:hypothetical protein